MPIDAYDSWRQCYRELAPKLLLFARQWAPQDAEDIVQAAFVRFWKKHQSADRSHYPLLYAAVRTIALDQLPGDRCRNAIALLNGLKSSGLTGGVLRSDASPAGRQSARDLLACGLVVGIVSPDPDDDIVIFPRPDKQTA